MYPFGYLQPVRPARLPLIEGILVNPEGPLGRRLAARHDDLSYWASMARRVEAKRAAGLYSPEITARLNQGR